MARERDRPWRRQGIDWKDPEAVRAYKREWRQKRREKEIETEMKKLWGLRR